jgi:hypothetical protein
VPFSSASPLHRERQRWPRNSIEGGSLPDLHAALVPRCALDWKGRCAPSGCFPPRNDLVATASLPGCAFAREKSGRNGWMDSPAKFSNLTTFANLRVLALPNSVHDSRGSEGPEPKPACNFRFRAPTQATATRLTTQTYGVLGRVERQSRVATARGREVARSLGAWAASERSRKSILEYP